MERMLAKNKLGKKYFRKQRTVDNILFFHVYMRGRAGEMGDTTS